MMFRWLKRIFSRSRDRLIFSYHDGTRIRRADPLAVMSRMEDDCPDYVDLLTLIGQDEDAVPAGPVRADLKRGRAAATKKLLEATRKTFDLKPLSDVDGLTDGETLGVFTGFLIFMGGLADEARPLPVSPPAESLFPAASPIASCAASGTIGT